MPAGWAKTAVSGSDALSFATSTTYPSGYSAYDGSYMVRFNSWSYGAGTVNRLYTTTPISTVGKEAITVEFAWLEGTNYSSPPYDRVTVQYSTDGATWVDGSTFNRYGPVTQWTVKTDALPAAVENQSTLYIAFLFTSQYGDDCYLDDVTVYGTPSGPPPVTFQIGAGTTTIGYPFYTFYHDSRTQMIYTASEILAAGGLPGQITALGFNVSYAYPQTMFGFNIDMQNYSGSTLSGFVSSGWTNVYSGAYTVTSTGWNIFSFATPFEWDGTSNVLVSVCFDNTGYTSNSNVYGTSTSGTTWHNHMDGGTGCALTGGASQSYRPNVQMTILPNPVLPTGFVQGFVTNAYGVPLPGATVIATGDNGDFMTTSGPNGQYIINDITIGTYTMAASKEGYNNQIIEGVAIYDGLTTYQNFSLTQPSMAVTPNPYSVTLNPNELFTGALNIANNGNGPLHWEAEVQYPETMQHNYPDYLSVRGDLPEVQAPSTAARATEPAPYISDNNVLVRDPDDLAYCYVAYAASSSLTLGPASFILNNPANITRFGNAASDFIAAADWANDTWYGVVYGGSMLTIDPVTGAYTNIGMTGDFVGISFNAQDDIMYGLTYSGSLMSINLATGGTTNIGAASTGGFIAFEIDNDGVAYAVNIDSDQFGTINLTNGQWTPIGPIGFNASYAQDMSCDPSTNELYWAAYDVAAGGKLLLVNKETGTSTLVGAFPGGAEIDGFAIPGSAGASGWLTLGQYAGDVNAFTNFNLPAYFNAEDTEAGEVYTANVVFTSTPNVGTVTVPVTMTIAGPALAMPDDLTAVLTDPIAGTVSLSWTFEPTDEFLNFIVKRDGVTVGTTTANTFMNTLPTYGVYEYTVQAVYDEGASIPAGPAEVEWPNPTMFVDPTYIYDEVWVNNQAVQTVTISNIGQGTLAFSFPDWIDDGGNRAPLAYCTASGGCDEYISNVSFNTINNSSGCSQYADYTSIVTELEIGVVYPITVTNPVPYSSDIVGIYIDWNHNEVFTDAGEFFTTTSSGGGASFTGNILVPETALSGPTRMRVRLQWGGTLSPCGSTSYGEVEDYTVDVGMPGFITSVVPAEGTIPQGGQKTITITWDATDFDPGMSYFEDLVVESNDLAHPSVTIENEMYVYVPAQFEGVVTDIETGEPLNGVVVTANPTGEYETYILDDGSNENGFGYTAGSTGSIGNIFNTDDTGFLTSVEAYFYSGAAMTVPVNVEIYDASHNLLGVSAPQVITNAGWYTFELPGIPYSGNFYCMIHWPMVSGSTRYLGWDSNGPNANANYSYELYDGAWSTFQSFGYYGVLQLRPTAYVTGETDLVTYNPGTTGKVTPNASLIMANVPGSVNSRATNEHERDLVSFQAMTDDNGFYSMYVDAGIYNVMFEKTGYQTYIEYDTTALQGVVTPLDAQLREESYPPSFVYAEVNEDDTEVLVTWGDGMGAYEVIYDDGSAENYAAWALPGNMNAVKFTPANYPAIVQGGRIYVGDGSFPNNNTGFIGVTFGAMVIDDDGPNGLPGTTLDSIQVVVGNYGWVTFTGLNAEITDGSFYLAMVQGTLSPNCAPVGVDQQNPIVYRSYSRNVVAGQGWGLSPYQDFMIRAIIFGSPAPTDQITENSAVHRNPVKQRGMISQYPPMAAAGGIEGQGICKAALDMLNGSRSVTGYRVVRYSNFDPNGNPETGNVTNLANNVQGNEYTDTQWLNLPGGWYAYGVAARYPDNYVSDTVISNIVGHHIDAQVTVNVALTTGGNPQGTLVMLTGQDYPYEVYSATVPETGQVIFPEVWYGHYAFHAEKVGFDDYDMNVNITGNKVIDIILAERKYKPRNLYVDPLTLVATWDEPLAIAVIEDFEGATFPPEGWQALTQNTTGWYATTNGSSASWTIPPHTKYAVTNDDADNGNGCCDYLITPQMDWTDLPTYRMNFASFFDGAYSQSAYVEISTDAGATWTVIYSLTPAAGAWQNLEIDLEAYSGSTGLANVWVAFHADDNGVWASGWAVDDVQISSGGVPHQGYGVFLDGTLVGNTLLQTFTYTNLNYGQEYLAGVAALYSSGYSELDTYLFRSVYLIPPTNLAGVNPPQTDYVHLTWVAPVAPTEYTVTDAEVRTAMPIASAEYSPTIRNVTYNNTNGSRELWDILFAFNAQAASMPGIETDGEYIYISNWQGTNFGKYEVTGTWVEDFTISGVANIRDMAYDGEFFYGGQASTTIYKMNFNDYTLEGTIPCAVSVRHIAWDPQADGGNGGFWAGNWSDLALVNMSGGLIQSVSIPLSGVYGSAYDGNTENGPFLWLFDQNGSGVDIHQFEIATTSFTGTVKAATDIPGFLSGSIAGGLATSSQLISGKFVLLGNIQQDPNLLFGYELGDASTTGPGVANLLGYNIYRDDEMIAYVAKPALEYFDLDLEPATYTYHITAVYDLTPYGYAGQTGESMIEGPIDVSVVYGYELPFTETWTTGLFETNQWTIDGNNWLIAGQHGNPAPAAEFTYVPVQTDYAISLSSYWINGTGFVDGKIYCDFDLKLDDNTATGEEKLLLEVFNGSVWVPAATFTAEGDMDWEMKHIDITNQAKGKVFRVRFTAKGLNTLDIINWQVDNINIYRLCEPPINLDASLPQPGTHGDQILLTWEPPAGGPNNIQAWLFWDNGENNDAIGLTGGGTFLVAVRFTPAQLLEYSGTFLTKVRLFARDAGGTIVLKVWTGANASQLVLSQPVPSYVSMDWNEFILTSPVPVTGTTELWFGYEITHGNGVYVAGCDAGPAVAGYGDMISLDGSVWESMSQAYALDYNWNLQGFVESLDGTFAPLQPIAQTTFSTSGEPVRGFLPQLPNTQAPVILSGSRELTGYNIFRDGEFIATTTETEYLDTDPEISVLGQEYCYKVTAVYEDCESDFSNEDCETVISADNIDISGINVYPNPSNSVINIELTNDISQLVIYNYVGQVVYEYTVAKDKNIQIDVRNYEAGAYLVKFITKTGESFAKKVAVTN